MAIGLLIQSCRPPPLLQSRWHYDSWRWSLPLRLLQLVVVAATVSCAEATDNSNRLRGVYNDDSASHQLCQRSWWLRRACCSRVTCFTSVVACPPQEAWRSPALWLKEQLQGAASRGVGFIVPIQRRQQRASQSIGSSSKHVLIFLCSPPFAKQHSLATSCFKHTSSISAPRIGSQLSWLVCQTSYWFPTLLPANDKANLSSLLHKTSSFAREPLLVVLLDAQWHSLGPSPKKQYCSQCLREEACWYLLAHIAIHTNTCTMYLACIMVCIAVYIESVFAL